MPARVAIRRLELRALAPRDHPAPGDLRVRLVEAARKLLPDAIEQSVRQWAGETVLRIRRLEVDITLETTFEPQAFATALARAIARQLVAAEQKGSSHHGDDGVVCYASRAIYLAALLEALAEGRAADQWWLRDAEGLRFLSRSQAIRTAILADPRVGLEALASLAPLRRMPVLRALSAIEADRVLEGLARARTSAADFRQCAEAVARAAAEIPADASALAIFVSAFALKPALAGEPLATATRLWTETDQVPRDRGIDDEATAGKQERDASPKAVADEQARRIQIEAARKDCPPQSQSLLRFTQFGGLLLLLSDLGTSDIAGIVSTWPEVPSRTAASIGHAALGLCVGRQRLAEYLCDTLWRELFDLDARCSVAALLEQLDAIPSERWAEFDSLVEPLSGRAEARFLLPPRGLIGSSGARHVLAGLARAATKRFARRLPGFAAASAPFLWTNLLAVPAALEHHSGGWRARLGRPPLDVLLSLARIADGGVRTPSGVLVDFRRASS
jgi:hypothetical protein